MHSQRSRQATQRTPQSFGSAWPPFLDQIRAARYRAVSKASEKKTMKHLDFVTLLEKGNEPANSP